VASSTAPVASSTAPASSSTASTAASSKPLPSKSNIISVINEARTNNGLNALTESSTLTALAQKVMENHQQYYNGEIDQETRNKLNQQDMGPTRTARGSLGYVSTTGSITVSDTQRWKERNNTASSDYYIVCGSGTEIGVATGWLADGRTITVVITG
jgi:hypothetical protein